MRLAMLAFCFVAEFCVGHYMPPPYSVRDSLIWATGWTAFSALGMWILTPRRREL